MHKSKKEQLVIINQNSGYLMIDLANQKSIDYDVTLITGRLIIRDDQLNEQITVEKIFPYNRSNTIKRIFTWIIAFIQILFKIKFKYPSAKLIIVSNPPVNVFLAYFIKNKFIYLIYDLYPEALTEQGILKNKHLIIKIWNKANSYAFRKAINVVAISNNMLNQIVSKYDLKNAKFVPLWSDKASFKIQSLPKENFFKAWAPNAKFIILYSGNIGLTQPLEALLKIANKLANKKDILFVIAGEGEKKQTIVTKIKEDNLENILVLGWQIPSNLKLMLSSANLGVIPLAKSASKISVPSKMFNYIAAGLPIIGICGPNSEVHQLIKSEKIGGTFSEDEIIQAADFILDLADNEDKLNILTKNVKLASTKFTNTNVNLIGF